jgi:hypothetical protein
VAEDWPLVVKQSATGGLPSKGWLQVPRG